MKNEEFHEISTIKVEDFYNKNHKYKNYEILSYNNFEIDALYIPKKNLTKKEINYLKKSLKNHKYDFDFLKELVIINGFIPLSHQIKYLKNVKLEFIKYLD